MVRIFYIWAFQSTSSKQKKEPKIGFDIMVCFFRVEKSCTLFKTVWFAVNLYGNLNLSPCSWCFFPLLCRRWRSWVWMNGRTSVGLVPGRIPRNTRSSSAPHRTKKTEVQGGQAEQAGRTLQQDGPETSVGRICGEGAAETQWPQTLKCQDMDSTCLVFCLCWVSNFGCVRCLEQVVVPSGCNQLRPTNC